MNGMPVIAQRSNGQAVTLHMVILREKKASLFPIRKHLIIGLTARLPTFWNIRNIWAVNFKTYSKSYKFKKRLPTSEDQQMIFETTHPALVEQEAWEQVQ